VTNLQHGVYDHVVTEGLKSDLSALDPDLVARISLDATDSHEVLARHVAALAKRALKSVGGSGREKVAAQIELANRVAAAMASISTAVTEEQDQVAAPAELLKAITSRPEAPLAVQFPIRPEIPLAESALLTNGRDQPRIGTEINRELASADRVDLLCAFIKFRGMLFIKDAVRDLLARGGQLRIITTTYMGATEQAALDVLAGMGAEIRVSYETHKTRLHAKAWLFRRPTGVSTAYVGSSNLSKVAITDGMEWNVRLSEMQQPSLLQTFSDTFEDYWNDSSFENYDPDKDHERLAVALLRESGTKQVGLPLELTTLDVTPLPYQREILEQLDAERDVHHRYRNLVVMATGTGKTVVAGLDYRRLRQKGFESLLFVAHQKHILWQSQSVFRHILHDGTFGEMFVDGERPEHWKHVFASVQSLHSMDITKVDPNRFDMVVIDEFHHAEANTYQKVLNWLQPRVLLGLTATPERTDGQDIRRWFDGHTAVELRLWEALERQFLSPFHYFGIHDNVDLKNLQWRRGAGYSQAQLEKIYSGNEARAGIILQAVKDIVPTDRMRALGFCVSIDHAVYMAQVFNEAGIPSQAVHSKIAPDHRSKAIADLRSGTARALFTVDLFNEGVDIPNVDTILMLRPTESATVFLQQLGRGLRLSDEKPYLTVLDFIGNQHAKFRFDKRYRALTGISRNALTRAIEGDFPVLPAGCHFGLDEVAKKIVLGNIRQALKRARDNMVDEIRQTPALAMAEFLEETGFEVEDIYRRREWGGWAGLRARAGAVPNSEADRLPLSSTIGRFLHFDDVDRIQALRDIAGGVEPVGRLGQMMSHTLWGDAEAAKAGMEQLATFPVRQAEVLELADVLEQRIARVTTPLDPSGVNPLRLHARYTGREAGAAFGDPTPELRGVGVKQSPDRKAYLFFVTIKKTERHYSPTTMYQDCAITETLFQWESQAATRTSSDRGQDYVHHAARGITVHLFLRESKEEDGDLGAPAYVYAGPMTYESHIGDQPMRIRWQLTHALPADVFHAARMTA
jgi:superfamily II DNA or RNA helicase/HKD family nuclease